jgi:outer membrane protein TolC
MRPSDPFEHDHLLASRPVRRAVRRASGVVRRPRPPRLGLGALALACLAALPACASDSLRPDYEGARSLITERTGRTDVYDPEATPMTEQEIRDVLADGLTLDEALRLALLNSRRLQAGFMGLGIGRADFVQAGLLENPSLGFGLLYPSGAGHVRIMAEMTQNVMDIWRLPERKAVAEAAMQQQVLRLARQAGELLAETKVAYYESVAAREAQAVADERAEVASRTVDAIRMRMQAGAASEMDVNLELSAALASRFEAMRAKRRYAAQMRRLASAFSLTWDLTEVALTDPLPAPRASFDDREALVERACASRLDLRAMAAAIHSAEARLALEDKNAVPDASLGIGYERPESSEPVNHLVGPALYLEVPIFDQNQAQISKARYELEQLLKAYEALDADVRQQVRAAVDEADLSAAAATFVREEFLPQAMHSADLAREAYRQGNTTLQPVLLVEGAEVDARAVEVEALLEAALALVELERALGGVLEEDPGTL